MTTEQHLVKRLDSLPQKPYAPRTFFDLFLEIMQQKGPPIELPDFFYPVMDVYESSTSVTVEIEIAGMEPQEFVIRVDGDLLQIKGEKRRVESLAEGIYSRRERRFGIFERMLRLPTEVDDRKTSTSYEHGVLKITLPKK
jgi:HSP20 family protein